MQQPVSPLAQSGQIGGEGKVGDVGGEVADQRADQRDLGDPLVDGFIAVEESLQGGEDVAQRGRRIGEDATKEPAEEL